MSVSVIVPVYNKERYLARTLASIVAQSLQDFEVIIVDDGSTDGSADIAASHPDRRFRLMSQRNAGPGAARNAGIAAASGEFVAFLDADDEWSPDYLSSAVARLRSEANAASITASYAEMPAGVAASEMWRARGLVDGAMRITPSTPPQLAVALLAFMSPCTTVFRADHLRLRGGFYERNRCLYGEDAHLCLKVMLNHPVLVDLNVRANIHRDASDLSANLSGARPVEPFLEDASEIRADCPETLRPLLETILAMRAFKTACVLGYWGEWRRAAELRRRFAGSHARGVPYRFASMACSTPLVVPLAAAVRALRLF